MHTAPGFWTLSWVGGKFGSDPASQNATWRQNGFTYRKKKLPDFGRIISYHMLKTVCKSVKRWLRSFGVFGAFLAQTHSAHNITIKQFLTIYLLVLSVLVLVNNSNSSWRVKGMIRTRYVYVASLWSRCSSTMCYFASWTNITYRWDHSVA